MFELTEENIKKNTYWSEMHYKYLKKNIEEYKQDLSKERRTKYQECKTCFYLRNGLAGQAFTKYNCQHCKEENMHPNTAVPKYCNNCAIEFSVCKRCGAKLD